VAKTAAFWRLSSKSFVLVFGAFLRCFLGFNVLKGNHIKEWRGLTARNCASLLRMRYMVLLLRVVLETFSFN
jgi:hypothetical protein